MNDNEKDALKALQVLREFFSDYEDLELELYNNYESLLNSYGVKLAFYFPNNIGLDYADFFQKHTLWDIFKGSMHLYDIFYSDLRMNMWRPWFISRDHFNLEISIGSVTLKINNTKNGIQNVYDLQSLLSQIRLFYNYPDSVNLEDFDHNQLVNEFKKNKHFIVKLIRTKKEGSVREFLEKQNYMNTPSDYRDFLERSLQLRVLEILNNADLAEETIRMHLQARLAVWGFRYSKILNSQEIIDHFKELKVSQIFPSLLEAKLFINSLAYNSNEQLVESIKNDNYKSFLNEFISKIENQKMLLMKYNGINLENKPEFIFKNK